RVTASTKARTFSASLASSKDTLPIPAWTTPAFSTLNWTSPPLALPTAAATSIVTVPTLGFGIRLRGPRILPSRPTVGIMSGVAMQRSNSILPLWIVSIRSSAPTISAPAASASSALAPRANTATRTVLPVPLGRLTTPRTIWSAWRGSTPRFIATSTVSSNFAVAADLTSRTASSIATLDLPSKILRAAAVRFAIFAMALPLHLDTHRPGRARDDQHRRIDVVGVEVLHLGLGDLAQLGDRHRTGDVLARSLAARLQLRGLLQQVRGRGRLDLHREGLVGEIGDDDRGRDADLHLLRARVERLAEFHDVDAALTQCRANGGRRVRLACRHLQLQLPDDFLGHDGLLLSCRRDASLAAPVERGPVRTARRPRLPQFVWSMIKPEKPCPLS